MRYIDFHVHAFADKIAVRTVESLAKICGEIPCTNGTMADTRRTMGEWGVDGIVLMSIATKPSQHLVCNNWAASQKAPDCFPFGSVHPDGEDVLEELERIRELGLYGVKLHPDYQNFFVDEERLYPIYRKCGELGLPVTLHAGFDPLCPDTVHCSPQAAARAAGDNPETTFIFAHMGSNALWDDVEIHMAGKYPNVYLDTALSGSHMEDDQLLRMIRMQGADRVLLASDCPWDSTAVTIRKLEGLPLTQEEKERIFYKNAQRLLRLA